MPLDRLLEGPRHLSKLERRVVGVNPDGDAAGGDDVVEALREAVRVARGRHAKGGRAHPLHRLRRAERHRVLQPGVGLVQLHLAAVRGARLVVQREGTRHVALERQHMHHAVLRHFVPEDATEARQRVLAVGAAPRQRVDAGERALHRGDRLGLDALQDLGQMIRGRKVVCVSSGGNFDFERLPEVKERAQRFAGVKKYLILRMPQRPGALKEFLNLLGPDDDITRFEYLKKSARNFGSILIGLETKNTDGFEAFFASLEAAGYTYSDITNDETLAQFVI